MLELLRAKIAVPPLRIKRAPRERLIARVDEGMSRALTLVIAPAGFGKTTLLAEWASRASMPVAFIGNVARWQVETKGLAEVDIARVALGAEVIVKLDAFPGEEFTGKVVAIDPVGREYLGDMTYTVAILLDESDPRFLWNMTATATISVSD